MKTIFSATPLLERVLKLGGAGDSPAPVGDPPTGTALSHVAKRPSSKARSVAPVPSGESPDGTGGSPVLPANHFSNTLLAGRATWRPCEPIHDPPLHEADRGYV